MLLGLVLLVIFLSNGGVWAQFTQQIANPAAVQPNIAPGPTTPLTLELTAKQGSAPLPVSITAGGKSLTGGSSGSSGGSGTDITNPGDLVASFLGGL
jgi:hypothetical protein